MRIHWKTVLPFLPLLLFLVVATFANWLPTHAQLYPTNTPTATSTGTVTTPAPVDQTQTTPAPTVPGVPNTGDGGMAIGNILALSLSALVIIGGVTYLTRAAHDR